MAAEVTRPAYLARVSFGHFRFRFDPGQTALLNFRLINQELQFTVGNIDADGIPFLDQADQAAFRRFRGKHGRYRRPRVAPENRPSVIKATEEPRPIPCTAAVGASISRIPGPPFGPS